MTCENLCRATWKTQVILEHAKGEFAQKLESRFLQEYVKNAKESRISGLDARLKYDKCALSKSLHEKYFFF